MNPVPVLHGRQPAAQGQGWQTRAACVVLVALAGLLPRAAVGETLDPAPMVLLPGGTFVMGVEGGLDCPAHTVQLDTFWIDAHEVTNAQYLAFCAATQHRQPEFWGSDTYHCGSAYPNHPVIGVSWGDASEYAAWCGKRLPTEAEWEYAARGGLAGRDFPNGDSLGVEYANHAPSKLGGPVAVGSYAANGFGLFDMAGNVVEWVADRYGEHAYEAGSQVNPRGPEKGRFRVIRGGGWHSGASCNRVHHRNALPSGWVDFAVGFRCAKDLQRAAGGDSKSN